jgi:hypothetical protein
MQKWGGAMTVSNKCAHRACECVVSKGGAHGKFCSEHCKEAGKEIELRCDCQHSECRLSAASTRAFE